MSTEADMILSWIESTLSGDNTLSGPSGYAPGGVVETFPLPGTTAPYLVVKHLSGQDRMAFGGRAFTELRFQAVAAGPLSALQGIQSAAARIDVLLTVIAQTAITGGTLMGSYREQSVNSDELVDSQKWRLSGGEYKIFAKSS